MNKKTSLFLLVTLIFLILVILPVISGAVKNIKPIFIEVDNPKRYCFTEKNPPPDDEVNYCLKVLNSVSDIISQKNYNELVDEEKEKVKLFYFLFVQTNICTSRLFSKTVEFHRYNSKFPDNKLTIIADNAYTGSEKYYYTKNALPLILEDFPQCKLKTSFESKIQCLRESNLDIFTSGGVHIPALLLLKHKYNNSVKLVILTRSSFLESYKKFWKSYMKLREKAAKPICFLEEDIIVRCPLFKLEKDIIYDKIYTQKWVPPLKLKIDPNKKPSKMEQNCISHKVYIKVAGIRYLKKGTIGEEEINKDYEIIKKIVNWFEKEFISRGLLTSS